MRPSPRCPGSSASTSQTPAAHSTLATILGVCAVALATINVIGGYVVTDRMLAMFKKKEGGKK